MKILHKFNTFRLMNKQLKWMYLEAYFYLAYARIYKMLPFAKVSHLLGVGMNETSYVIDETNSKTIKSVSHAIHHMSTFAFWESQCLVKAIAGMKMLERRKIESTLYFGTGKDETGKLVAHAWLRSGQIYLSGADEMHEFTVVGMFAKKSMLDYEGE
ncbi:lasso peptide biosynthesis B2 protein [Cytobacillus purgationiresistens]|uniref:Microcin J25-processing protein McjB C-terminal domain-containing protein n=1 Tax=Cytobacillus purgationiresistens TaxID=863449 RepID=A0ABU0AKL2_9BACI|nr:lasso peptide biosynthesis B2 protein [Cytobacillus purgationiresistens]MDQ0270918.1 hypothetical protein [Cytobacillus purgationiresistens]